MNFPHPHIHVDHARLLSLIAGAAHIRPGPDGITVTLGSIHSPLRFTVTWKMLADWLLERVSPHLHGALPTVLHEAAGAVNEYLDEKKAAAPPGAPPAEKPQ